MSNSLLERLDQLKRRSTHVVRPPSLAWSPSLPVSVAPIVTHLPTLDATVSCASPPYIQPLTPPYSPYPHPLSTPLPLHLPFLSSWVPEPSLSMPASMSYKAP